MVVVVVVVIVVLLVLVLLCTTSPLQLTLYLFTPHQTPYQHP